MVILIAGLVTGAIIKLPGGSTSAISQGSALVVITACLVIAVVTPFALLASVGRGYLLSIAGAILAMMMANVVGLAGWGEYFPWGVPGLYAMGKSPLTPISYWIVLLTGVTGVIGTWLWWKYADQNR
jgi:ABC-2 type transport system permease protein